MPQIQIDDRIFQAAKRRATDGGYASVEQYITDVVAHDLSGPQAPGPFNSENYFTPEIIADLDRISAEINAGGKTYTSAEVGEHFQSKLRQWREEQAT